jgi:F-type H+-transporting ATPase subunit b
MRTSLTTLLLAVTTATPAFAAEGGVNLLDPNTGLMAWTLIIFVILFVVLAKFAFGPITRAVEARERALSDAIEAAKRDREEAARILADHKRQLDESRGEAQKMIAEGRATGEKMRADLLEQTRREQAEMLERARREIENEKTRAIAELRREAVDLAIAGASRVVEQNLDSQGNRKLVESYLASVGPVSASARR